MTQRMPHLLKLANSHQTDRVADITLLFVLPERGQRPEPARLAVDAEAAAVRSIRTNGIIAWLAS